MYEVLLRILENEFEAPFKFDVLSSSNALAQR